MLTQFLKNSMDRAQDQRSEQEGTAARAERRLAAQAGDTKYNPQTGASFDKYGHEMTAGVRMAYGSKPTERLNQATQLLHTPGVMGKTDKATVHPTAMQAAQGLDEDYFSGQTGYNAHKTMYDLFNRSDETWSSEDTQSRDRARQELSDEMYRIMKRYGLTLSAARQRGRYHEPAGKPPVRTKTRLPMCRKTLTCDTRRTVSATAWRQSASGGSHRCRPSWTPRVR